jgi:hypothetical protein
MAVMIIFACSVRAAPLSSKERNEGKGAARSQQQKVHNRAEQDPMLHDGGGTPRLHNLKRR